jgi:DNA-binding CsgD family transcriptional regulator
VRPSVGRVPVDLTPAQESVALLVAAGRRNDEIAAALGLHTKTIEWHLSRIYRKLGLRSRTELAVRFSPYRDRG